MRKVGLYIILWLLCAGCEMASEFSSSPRENFEALWKIMDEHYCFFEYKQIDWDEVYEKYNLQITDALNEYELFDVLGNMLNELKDGHTNLISSFNISRSWDWYESHPPNFYVELQEYYLGKSSEYEVAGGIKYRRLKGNRIGYIYYDSFSNSIGESDLDHIFDHFKDCKGLIVDIRENGGGSLNNSDRLASRFVKEKLLVGYMQHKVGKGHSDFSNPHPVYLTPSSRTQWHRPVAVLTNRHCYSAANDFVQKMRMNPQVTIIGDRTGGGSGFPFNSELPNGWSVRFSSSPMLDANMQHTEFGIDPDIHINILPLDIAKDQDPIIEEALRHLFSQPESGN